jgi:OOP family OmpA-OmpF porin
MRWMFMLLLVILVVPMFVTDGAAECGRFCKCPACTARDKAVTNFIYDVTIPWPFRHHTPVVIGDADGDGVNDAMDKCPGTPKGAVVDAAGCPMDSDGDGVYDGLDKCPDTPKGAKVDVTGCPMDSDGDGVYDGIDKCPDTPKGTRVNNTGCPVTKVEQALLDTGVFTTNDILFDTGKDTIKPKSDAILAEIGAVLVAHPEVKLEVRGHTDSQGADAMNQALSERRAKAVQSYLLDKYPDIEKDQLAAKGYGESRPVASNDTADGRAKNRRVEFRVLSK